MEIFEAIVRQINGPVTPLSMAAIIGRIPATWQQVQQRAADYLGERPEEQWPESQNKFAQLLNTNSSTLRKAIDKSHRDSLLASWDRLKSEWTQNKRRTRSDQPREPAVVSLQDAPEPISYRHDAEDEAEVRELLDQHTPDKLVEMLKDVFVRTMRKLGKPQNEIDREWPKLKSECDHGEAIARSIILLRQQYQDMFDTDPRAKIKRRRKP